MTITDDNHRAARVLKDHEERLSDLEETSRSGDEPNPLATVEDGVGVGDRVDAVRTRTLAPLLWGDDGARDPDGQATGWGVGTWGGD